MQISKDTVVVLDYELTVDGEVIDSSKGHGPLSFLQGHHNVIPGFETAVEGLKKGDKKTFTVAPEDGYGVYDEEATKTYPIDEFPGGIDLVEGSELVYETDDNQQIPCVITQVTENEVTIDFNHPLAGQTLNFAIEILDVKKASAEELQHGHVHGEHGHHH